jgi:signal transduction histidine kinase
MINLRSIRWRLPFSYAGIALLATLALGSVMLLVLNNYYTGLEREYLSSNAQGLQPFMAQVLKDSASSNQLKEQVTWMAFLSMTQIRVLDSNGQVLSDSGIPGEGQFYSISSQNDAVYFNVATDTTAYPAQPAIIQAGPIGETASQTTAQTLVITSLETPIPSSTAENIGVGVAGETAPTDHVISISAAPLGGYSFTTEKPSSTKRSAQAISLPLENSGYTLELSHGPAYGSDILFSVALAWAAAALVATLLAGLVGWRISQQVIRPVLALTEATHRLEMGELSSRVQLENEKQQEFQSLAHVFNSMALQVENTVSTLRHFVSDAAHELNTPLTALKTNLELAASETDPAQKALFLHRAIEQNQRLEDLSSSLLDLSRLEAAALPAQHTPLDLRQLLSEIGETYASRAEQSGQSFSLILPEESVWVSGNYGQLQRAAANLLENALKFTPSGGCIQLSLETDAQQAVISVSDSGIGVPPEDLPQLFERFHRGRNSGAYPGSGLGLAIVRAIARTHNGQVEAQRLEPGSRFVLFLPRIHS